MASLASINIKFSADLKGLSTELQNAMREIKKTGESFQKIGSALTVGFTLPILAAGAASVKLASDYEESLNKVSVAFGSSSSSVESFGDTTLETFGIAKGTALDMAALFGDMATSMGLPQSEAATLSKSLVGLAGDLASFKNIGIEQATTALNGVFTGETESLKLLGIVMTEANLAQFALTQGITKSVKEMSQAEKVQLRYAYVMEKTKNAQGDFSRTQGGSANQMRIFQESMKEVGQQFGAILLPAFTKLVKSLNGMVKSFSELSPGVKETIVIVAGLVAVIGPLLAVFGTILTLIPSMVAGFATLKVALTAFTASIAANPLGLLLVGLTGVIAYLAITKTSFESTVKSINNTTQEVLKHNKASQELGDEVQKLVERYDELKAKTKLSSIEQKELSEIIVKIGKIVPAAVTEVDKYGEALQINAKKAREFTDSQKELIALRTQKQLQDSIVLLDKLEKQKKSLTISEEDLNSKYVSGIGYIRKRNGVLELYNRILSTSRALTVEELILFKEKVVANEQNISTTLKNISTLKGLNDTQADATESTKTLKNEIVELKKEREKVIKAGTIAFYQNEIDKLKKLQTEQVTTASNYALIGNEIERFQEKIDKIQLDQIKIEPIKIETDTSSFDLSELTTAAEEFPVMFDTAAAATEERMRMFAETMTLVSEAVGSVFGTLTDGFIDSLELADTGLAGFAKNLLKTITKLIAMALSASIANAIQIGTQTGVSTGPAAVFTTPAFIATAVGGVLAAFAAIPKFATGGVVGGSSVYGDKILARVNSGELILNTNQQKNLYGMLSQNASASNVNIGVQDIVLDGNKIRIILDRTDAINNRKR